MEKRFVTELIITTFGYPYPYKLSYVAQYRFVHQVGEFLVRRDEHQNLIGGLARSWTISPDRHKITFHLRPGLYSADEVAQSLRRLIHAGQTSHSNLAAQTDPKKIVVLDPLNLEIETTGDAGAILSPLVMADAVILPDDHWKQVAGYDKPQIDWRKTKGPYIYVSGKFPLAENETIAFKPNPNHYFFKNDQLDWNITYIPMERIGTLKNLGKALEDLNGFTTVRYSELNSLFFTEDPGVAFYETRPNGVCFAMPNKKSTALSSNEARVTLLKKIWKANIPTLQKTNRADQIPQPGLAGRLLPDTFTNLQSTLEKIPDHRFSKPLVWLVPNGNSENKAWIKEIADSVGLPYELKSGSSNPLNPEWVDGQFDLQIASVGMSDTDPISGATFLFSPTAANLDFPDGRVLKLLNSAKDTTDRAQIVKVAQEAFKIAIENGLLFPITYTLNRHYHAKKIVLNIRDPYSESIKIWDVRLNP